MSDTNTHEKDEADTSPGAVSKRSGVRRVNNRPMYILLGVLGSFILAMAMVAADRAAEQDELAEAPRERGGGTKIFAEVIAADHMDGMIPSANPVVEPEPEAPAQPPQSSEPQILVVRPTEALDGPPLPPRDEGELDRTQDELRSLRDQLARLQDQVRRPVNNQQPDLETQRIRDARLELLKQAAAAKTGVEFSAPRSIGSTESSVAVGSGDAAFVQSDVPGALSNDALATYNAQLQQLQASGILGNDGGGSAGRSLRIRTDAGPAAGSETRVQFNSTGSDSRWHLGNEVEAPASPYELRAGFVVPGTLISGINSDLPGTIMAQVSQNVYDTATGRHLLIPQGARLVGTYSSDVAFGQSRVLVAWQRIVFPDGKALDIGSMPGADGAGFAGFEDQVNNHYFRVFASALLLSGITAGISFSQGENDDGDDDNPTIAGELTRALGQQLGEVSTQLIERNLNIAPTLEIRPGYRFNIIVVKDITFPKPYQAFDY